MCARTCMHACIRTHVCMVIHVRVCHWCVPQNAYKVDFRYHFSPSTLLETGSVCCSSLHKLQASRKSPVPASCLAKGALGLQSCTNTSDFTRVLKIQTWVLNAYTAKALPIESSAYIIVSWIDQWYSFKTTKWPKTIALFPIYLLSYNKHYTDEICTCL